MTANVHAQRLDGVARPPSSNSTPEAKVFVAASLGPYGAHLADGSEYHGEYRLLPEAEAMLRDFHRPRIAVLLAEKPDVLLFGRFRAWWKCAQFACCCMSSTRKQLCPFNAATTVICSGEPLEDALKVLLECKRCWAPA